jgi:hypothetical protein
VQLGPQMKKKGSLLKSRRVTRRSEQPAGWPASRKPWSEVLLRALVLSCAVACAATSTTCGAGSVTKNLGRGCGQDGASVCPTRQKNSWGNYGPELATDGNLQTTSLAAACSNCNVWDNLYGDTDPWWRVELVAMSSVSSVGLMLPPSATLGPNNVQVVSHPLSIYLGESPDFANNKLCAADVSGSPWTTFEVPCQGVGTYLHIVMPGQDRVLRLIEVSIWGCQDCAAGKYQGTASWGGAECIDCAAGKYSGTASLTVCSSCFEGKYTFTGASVCTACAAGSTARPSCRALT